MPVSNDYYGFFGIPRRLALDTSVLQKRFYELSRQYHPDRFARKAASERLQAEESTAILNDGYRILKDPVSRAEYVLKQEGFDIGEQRSKDVPPELLEEVFEFNMALEDPDADLEGFKTRFAAMREEIDSKLQSLFAQYDSSPDKSNLLQIRNILNRRRYIRNLINQADKVHQHA
ncbi:MAG: Fe-S protein assembly co-chaperone HscB [Acidobacteria bacterium]|nr:Fe-S protein assembly co-chaperone HscB [Acidobacteriota bacterium]